MKFEIVQALLSLLILLSVSCSVYGFVEAHDYALAAGAFTFFIYDILMDIKRNVRK